MGIETINVVGAGILGLWQAYQLAKDGFQVRLYEISETPFIASSSWLAGAMLAPYCEAEASEPGLLPLALKSIALWRESPFDLQTQGTLVVAHARDQADLKAFAKRSEGHRLIGGEEIAQLEPLLSDRFQAALYYKDEAHLAPRFILHQMLEAIKALKVEMHFGHKDARAPADLEIDTRGMGAKKDLSNLRPVRGEMVVVELKDFELTRPVRLLHPRMPCYIVPWPEQRYMIGATLIESDDQGPMSVRSALELLGAAYAVHPAFGEAKILELNAGSRPSFPDNLPHIQIEGQDVLVNGAYRHGFLLAPLLASQVSSYIRKGERKGVLFQ